MTIFCHRRIDSLGILEAGNLNPKLPRLPLIPVPPVAFLLVAFLAQVLPLRRPGNRN